MTSANCNGFWSQLIGASTNNVAEDLDNKIMRREVNGKLQQFNTIPGYEEFTSDHVGNFKQIGGKLQQELKIIEKTYPNIVIFRTIPFSLLTKDNVDSAEWVLYEDFVSKNSAFFDAAERAGNTDKYVTYYNYNVNNITISSNNSSNNSYVSYSVSSHAVNAAHASNTNINAISMQTNNGVKTFTARGLQAFNHWNALRAERLL